MASQKPKTDMSRGHLDLMVLSVLLDGPRYGYRIQQRLVEASGGLIDVKPGTLYPLLHRLESDKLIRARWDQDSGRKRKWYELTASGRRRLKQQAIEWDRYAMCLRALLAPVLESQPEPT